MMRIEKRTFKMLFILIIIIILLGCCIIGLQNPEKYTFVLLPSKYLVLALSGIGIVVIPYVCNFLIRLIFSKTAFFEINKKGIYNGLGFTKKKQIEWECIKEIDIINYQGISRIRIKVFDNEPFIENTDFIKKIILKQTINELSTPILIDNVYLKCSFEELSKMVLSSWEKYKSDLGEV